MSLSAGAQESYLRLRQTVASRPQRDGDPVFSDGGMIFRLKWDTGRLPWTPLLTGSMRHSRLATTGDITMDRALVLMIQTVEHICGLPVQGRGPSAVPLPRDNLSEDEWVRFASRFYKYWQEDKTPTGVVDHPEFGSIQIALSIFRKQNLGAGFRYSIWTRKAVRQTAPSGSMGSVRCTT